MKRQRFAWALTIWVGAAVLINVGLLLLGLGFEQLEKAGPLSTDVQLMRQTHALFGDAAEGAFVQVSALGSKTVLTLVVVVTAIFLLLARKYALCLKVIIVGTGAGLLTILVKHWVERPRPQIFPWKDEWVGESYSFPSGHALSSMAIYFSLAVLMARLAPNQAAGRFVLWTGIGLALLIGLSRVYLGVHYPSDVLAGWLAGLLWAVASLMAVRLWLPPVAPANDRIGVNPQV